jgi:hypothetical protein
MTNASVRILRDALRLSNSWDWWKIALHSLLRAQAANGTLASAALAPCPSGRQQEETCERLRPWNATELGIRKEKHTVAEQSSTNEDTATAHHSVERRG